LSQAIIVLGDMTDHCGVVISSAPVCYVDGRRVARKGDMVACPCCKGVFPIAEGNPTIIFHDAQVAFHGCKVACGATLLSSQSAARVDILGGASGGASASRLFGPVGAGMLAGYVEEALDEQGRRYRGRFQLIHEITGLPVSGHSARVLAPYGHALDAATDGQGYTQWVERAAAESLSFDFLDGGEQ
jgi:uncharacterized Zn-binding protein involved in type VI secretion